MLNKTYLLHSKFTFTKGEYMKKAIIIGIVIIVVILGIAALRSNQPGQYDEFAKCLADSGAKMYGAWWCTHCQDQKKIFGNSWKVLENNGGYVECSPAGTRSFSQFCKNQGIQGTPTWKFPNDSDITGKTNLYSLAQKSGCEL